MARSEARNPCSAQASSPNVHDLSACKVIFPVNHWQNVSDHNIQDKVRSRIYPISFLNPNSPIATPGIKHTFPT